MLEQVDHPGAVGKPQHLPHGVGTDRPAAWAIAWSNSESESRTEPSAARAMMPSASGSTSTPSFFAMLEDAHQHVGLDPAEIETLAARQHRDRDFADFGGGEHELGVLAAAPPASSGRR
jgi:hypothetical protein